MSDVTTDAPSFAAEPILRPRQQVEEQLKRAILSGVFQHHDRLPSENKLADQFGVSRATVREALRSLASSGLITKTPGARGGSFVEYVDHHALSDLLSDRLRSTLELGSVTYDEVAQFRNLLEIPTARLAAEHRTEEQLKELEAVIEREKTVEVTDPAVPELNIAFHSTLGEASGNRVLAASVASLHRVTHPLAFIETSPELGKQAVLHHIAIVAGIRAKDPDQAADAMEAHLEYFRSNATGRWASDETPATP